MEIKLTLELEEPKDVDRDLVLAAAEESYRATIEQLKEASSKAAFPLVSKHSDWALEIDESDWDCDFFGGSWCCDISIYLKITEFESGEVVDEFLAWELLGEPLDKEVYEPLHSCDWSGLQGREEEGIRLQFSSLQVTNSSKGDGLYFHYDVQYPRLLPQPPQ
jgi:hypothetical protein